MQTLKQLSSQRTIQQVCEYGDLRISELEDCLLAAMCYVEDAVDNPVYKKSAPVAMVRRIKDLLHIGVR